MNTSVLLVFTVLICKVLYLIIGAIDTRRFFLDYYKNLKMVDVIAFLLSIATFDLVVIVTVFIATFVMTRVAKALIL